MNKKLKQTDRDYIYDNLIDAQTIINDLVEQMWEDEVDEEELKWERRVENFSIWLWFFMGVITTFMVLWFLSNEWII